MYRILIQLPWSRELPKEKKNRCYNFLKRFFDVAPISQNMVERYSYNRFDDEHILKSIEIR